jgi:serine/threonine-protein phosphatase 6 regulatory subunit 3
MNSEEQKLKIEKPETSLKGRPMEDIIECSSDLVNSEIIETTKHKPNMLLEKLLSFLSNAPFLNPVLAGYFSKVLNALLEKHKDKLLDYLFEHKEYIENMIKHVYSTSIANNLSTIIINEVGYVETVDKYSVEKHSIIDELIKKMEVENVPEDIEGSCSVLIKLITGKQYIDYFTKEQTMKSIFNLAKSSNVVSLSESLNLVKSIYQLKTGTGESNVNDTMEDIPGYSVVIKHSTGYLDFAKRYLEIPNKNLTIETPYGTNIKPFGLYRLKIIDWLQSLILLKEPTIYEKLESINMASTLMSLVKQYNMNSILHCRVLEIFKQLISTHTGAVTLIA